jgi:predicted lactoylglutathione lyase
MKITSFNPLIVTKDAETAIKMFEELGFEKNHTITVQDKGEDITTVCMKDSGGFHVDIAQSNAVPRDLTLIRMNVDDFDEAYKFLTDRGFKSTSGSDKTVDTKTNRSIMMVSPTGFAFDLCQHIKE